MNSFLSPTKRPVTPATELRRLLAFDRPLVAALALDPLSAREAAAAGCKALYVGGGALGYVSTFTEATLELSELLSVVRGIRAACDLPVILDGTCGWGDPMHLGRTMVLAETAGVAAIEIEDQLLPKRAHHHIGIEHPVSIELMTAKIRAAVDARSDPNFVIIARTNACRSHNLEEAVLRARAYRDAGADLVLVIPADIPQFRQIGEALDFPLVAMPPQGLTSLGMTLQEADDLGYRLIVDAMTPLLARQKALRNSYRAIAALQNDPLIGREHADELDRIHKLIGLEQMLEIERRTVELGQEAPTP